MPEVKNAHPLRHVPVAERADARRLLDLKQICTETGAACADYTHDEFQATGRRLGPTETQAVLSRASSLNNEARAAHGSYEVRNIGSWAAWVATVGCGFGSYFTRNIFFYAATAIGLAACVAGLVMQHTATKKYEGKRNLVSAFLDGKI